MNWKKESENELREFEIKKEALINIPETIKRIDAEISLIKQNRYSNNYWDDLLVEDIIKKSELERNLSLIKCRINLVENGLRNISDEDRKLLEAFYIDRATDYVTKLCEELGYEKSSIYYRKDIALRHFILTMYGYEETTKVS